MAIYSTQLEVTMFVITCRIFKSLFLMLEKESYFIPACFYSIVLNQVFINVRVEFAKLLQPVMFC